MALAPGTRLGPYEIRSPLGAGGMGEVYRAVDTRLNRTVAIKILPEMLAETAESRARFEREARAVSSLNHPHICVLYDIGRQDGIEFLVMEYLEGETLTRRLERGSLPLGELLRIGIEIADALDKSHRQGMVHRDLKPGNVMLTKSGAKLLDFGLAKTAAPLAWDLSSSPTTSRPLGRSGHGESLTAEGSIVGTFQYISPEQLEGKAADARSDIFSLGSVLYEMAVGKKAFEAESQASLIAAILEHEPTPISKIRPALPASFDRAVRTCLSKNSEDRFQSAHDLKLQLEWIREAGSSLSADVVTPSIRRQQTRRAWIFALAGAVGIALPAAVVTMFLTKRPAPDIPTMRFTIAAPENTSYGLSLAIAPNGKLLAFVAASGGKDQLWIRPLDSLEGHALDGTVGASLPFWSPDNSSIGFFADGKVKRIDLSTGAIQPLCDAVDARGGSWGADGTILVAPDSRSPLRRCGGGKTASAVTELDRSKSESSHRWPFFLPDGRHFLYFARTQGKTIESIYVGARDSTERKYLLESGSAAAYAEPGYLLFVRGRTLFAQAFDARKLELRGEAVAIAEGVESTGEIGPSSYAPFSISANGVLVYRTGAGDLAQLTWFDRHGKPLETLGAPGRYDNPTLSPDGKRISLDRTDPSLTTSDVYLVELATGVFSRFTFDPTSEGNAVWSADGTRIAYSANRSGEYNIYSRASNGSSNEERVIESKDLELPVGFSPDGKFLVYGDATPGTDYDFWLLPLTGEDRKPRPYIVGQGIQQFGSVSPDGRWFTYESDETGRYEIYVQSFPSTGGKWQITSEGGFGPQWRRDGRELFYLAANRKIMAVPTELSSTFHAGAPEALFEAPIDMNGIEDSSARFVFSPDGQRVLVVAHAGEEKGASSGICVVSNWPATLLKK
jgi:serine/threonine protein kinase/Tol biopolymer transport system component